MGGGAGRGQGRYPGAVRSRWDRARQVVGIGIAFALVFAPGEALAGSASSERTGVSTSDVAAAVLAPTFVSTPLVRPDPPTLLDGHIRSAQLDGRLPVSFLPAFVPAATGVLALLLSRRHRSSPEIRLMPAYRPPSAWRLRAPPLSAASASA